MPLLESGKFDMANDTDVYYCQECGAMFLYQDIHFERVENRHFWLDDCPVEVWCEKLCPECGSWCIEEAEYCEWCGEPFKPGELVDGFCEDCRKELGDEFFGDVQCDSGTSPGDCDTV